MNFCHPSRRSGPCYVPAVGYALLLPAVGPLFSPAVGPLFSVIHHGVLDLRRRRLLVDSPLSSTELLASCLQHHPVLSSCTRSPASLLASASVSRAPYPHRLRSVVPWFVKGLRCLDELFARPRADPRVSCCTWSGGLPAPLAPVPPHAARVEGVVSRARLL